jgi:hypothetical protein
MTTMLVLSMSTPCPWSPGAGASCSPGTRG